MPDVWTSVSEDDEGPHRVFGFVFATPQEADPFRVCLSACRASRSLLMARPKIGIPQIDSWDSHPIAWIVSGIGRRPAHRAARFLIDKCGVNWLISSGVSGALRPGLPVGTVLYIERVVDEDGVKWETTPVPGSPETSFHGMVLLCARNVIGSPMARANAAERWNADAVDMESAGVAEAARGAGIPFSCMRSISDAFEDLLPLDFTPFIDKLGQIRMGRLVAAAMLHPRSIPALARLGTQTGRASRTLARALETVLHTASDNLPVGTLPTSS